MRKLLLLLSALLLSTGANAATIICTPGVVECNGTDGDDIILVNAGDSTNHTIDTKKGDFDVVQAFSNAHITVSCLESKAGLIYAGFLFIPASATVNCGDGDWQVASSLKALNATMGNGNNNIVTGPGLPYPDPIEDNTVVTGNGMDVVSISYANDNIATGGGDDKCYGVYGNHICLLGAGNDFTWIGIADSIYAGGAGADVFYSLADSALTGDKEILDFDATDIIDLSSIPAFTFESLLPLMYIVPPPAPLAYNPIKDGDDLVKVAEYRELKKKHPVWKRERRKTSGATVIHSLKKQKRTVNVANAMQEFRRQLNAELKPVAGGFFVSDAVANPGIEPGDLVIGIPEQTSLIVKDGGELIMNGQLTQSNFKFAQ